MKRRILLFGLLSLGGCSHQKMLPDDYSGPTAIIKDSYIRRKEKGLLGFEQEWAELFVITRADGKDLTNASNTVRSPQSAPMEIQEFERRIPAKPINVRIERIFVSAYNPLAEPVERGRRDLLFQPVAGETYVVRGKPTKKRLDYDFSLWIETASGKRVTE